MFGRLRRTRDTSGRMFGKRHRQTFRICRRSYHRPQRIFRNSRSSRFALLERFAHILSRIDRKPWRTLPFRTFRFGGKTQRRFGNR